MYRLTEQQLCERRKKQVYKESKKGITYSEKSKRLAGINIYVTNTPWGIVPMEQIHDFYSLRWQMDIIFKTWKSQFQIHHWQNIKQERLESHVYGKLIAIFLCSSTMFKMRQFILQKKEKKLSEYKAIGMIQDHFVSILKLMGMYGESYKQTKDVAILQEILNHSTPQITLKYIGINKEEKDNIPDNFYI